MDWITELIAIGDNQDGLNPPKKVDVVINCLHHDANPDATYCFDMSNPPIKQSLLDSFADYLNSQVFHGGKVLVHCGAGQERSPLAVAWYFHRITGMSLEDAFKFIALKRDITPHPEWVE